MSDLSKVAFGERLGRREREVQRILDPDHGTRNDRMEEAAVALGGRLDVATGRPACVARLIAANAFNNPA